MTKQQLTYAFIGAGNMSGAIIGGMVQQGFSPEQIIAVNRSADKQQILKDKYNVIVDCSGVEAVNKADIIVFGVKPQMMSQVLTDLVDNGASFENKLVISVAAGIKCETYIKILGNVRLVRCMPNTPSLVGKGISGLYMGTDTHSVDGKIIAKDRQIATNMFSAVGEAIWLEQEPEIDTFTAICGSGPAYFFLFMEAMAAKAKEMGYSDEVAQVMVQQTALGAAKMATMSEESFTTLRKNVTSPGGSTERALEVFNDNNLPDIVAEALQAAAIRAHELGNS